MSTSTQNPAPAAASTADSPQVTQGTVNGTEGAVSTPETSPAAQSLKKFKVKVDDQELELDEAELIKGYQTSKAADNRFNQAAAMRRQAEAFMKLAKENPRKALTELGIDIKDFTEGYLSELVQDNLLTPEQKEAKDLKARLAEYEKREADAKAAQEQAEAEEATKRFQHEYEIKFISALETSGLPKTPDTLRRMAQKQLIALKKGIDISPQDLAGLVKLDMETEYKSLFGALSEEQLAAYLGEETTKKLLKLSLKAAQPAPEVKTPENQPPTPSADKRQQANKKYLSKDELKARLDQRLGKS